jgi:adenylate cyclase
LSLQRPVTPLRSPPHFRFSSFRLRTKTGGEAKAYVADALTTTIISELPRIQDAFVVPVATAFSYQNKAQSVQQIGKDAAVRFVLQGSVMASGDKLRITAQLAQTRDGA